MSIRLIALFTASIDKACMDKDIGEWCHLQGLGRLVAHVTRDDSRVVCARLWLHPLHTTRPFLSLLSISQMVLAGACKT